MHSSINVKLIGPKKVVYDLVVHRFKDQARISHGWEEFALATKLKFGDAIRIEEDLEDKYKWHAKIVRMK